MGENLPQPHAEPEPREGAAGRRLESWKEIAAYLKRDIRTVKRWEKKEGLPVRRHLHQRQASVYAYEEELEAWRANRSPGLEAEEVRGQEETGRRTRRLAWLAAAAALVVASVGVGYWLTRAPALPFAERDWVLISHFENRTGEQVFDGAVEYALERELANSRFVNVVPQERVQDALRLMRKPPDTAVDASVGREVCLRDGGIRALITGRVEKLDTTYLLSVGLVNPQTGVTVASFSEEAVGQGAVMEAVRPLADRVREALGEQWASIGRSEEKLAKVTTPSLHASKLFTQADALIATGNSATAEELLREAIVADPEFASAYTHLAHTILNQGRPREEALPYAKKGVALSGGATERERFFILASYYGMTGQDEKALATFEALLRLYPDYLWANANMSHYLLRRGRYEEAARYRGRAARLRPNDLDWNLFAAGELSRWASKPFEGQPYVERVQELASPERVAESSQSVRLSEEGLTRSLAWQQLYPAREYWLEDDMENVQREVATVAGRLESLRGRERDLLAENLGQFYLTLGKFAAAEEVSPNPANRAILGLLRDDRPAVRDYVRRTLAKEEDVGPVEAILAARLGMMPEAEEALRISEKSNLAPFWAGWSAANVNEGVGKIMRGELARARGRTDEALRLLEEGFKQLPPLGFSTYFLAAESLADLYEQQGSPEKAIEVLRKAGGERRRAVYYSGLATVLWMRNQARLAELYRGQGRRGEADELDAELHKLLALADPGLPILQQLKTTQALTATGPGR